jgi:hypothetical protein
MHPERRRSGNTHKAPLVHTATVAEYCTLVVQVYLTLGHFIVHTIDLELKP